jgi:hypothetical protein
MAAVEPGAIVGNGLSARPGVSGIPSCLPSCGIFEGIFPAAMGATEWALDETQGRYDQAVPRESNSKGREDD